MSVNSALSLDALLGGASEETSPADAAPEPPEREGGVGLSLLLGLGAPNAQDGEPSQGHAFGQGELPSAVPPAASEEGGLVDSLRALLGAADVEPKPASYSPAPADATDDWVSGLASLIAAPSAAGASAPRVEAGFSEGALGWETEAPSETVKIGSAAKAGGDAAPGPATAVGSDATIGTAAAVGSAAAVGIAKPAKPAKPARAANAAKAAKAAEAVSAESVKRSRYADARAFRPEPAGAFAADTHAFRPESVDVSTAANHASAADTHASELPASKALAPEKDGDPAAPSASARSAEDVEPAKEAQLEMPLSSETAKSERITAPVSAFAPASAPAPALADAPSSVLASASASAPAPAPAALPAPAPADALPGRWPIMPQESQDKPSRAKWYLLCAVLLVLAAASTCFAVWATADSREAPPLAGASTSGSVAFAYTAQSPGGELYEVRETVEFGDDGLAESSTIAVQAGGNKAAELLLAEAKEQFGAAWSGGSV